jgi:hypothetical protein
MTGVGIGSHRSPDKREVSMKFLMLVCRDEAIEFTPEQRSGIRACCSGLGI